LFEGWSTLTGIIIHSNHLFDDDRARSLLALAKGLVTTSSAAQLVARHSAFAQKRASHNAEVTNLMDFALMIEGLIGQLLATYDNAVRPYLEQRRTTLHGARLSSPEGGELIAAELAMIDRLLGAISVSAPPRAALDTPTSPKAKARSKRAGAK
jgi:hypothetical protein